MNTSLAPLTTAAMLAPPRGYRILAWIGLAANVLALPLAITLIQADPTWRTINIAVAGGAMLPTVVVGVIACIALLMWRPWGQVLAIIALSMSLAVALPYGIVRLVLVGADRWQLAVAAALFLGVNAGALVFWCRPAIRNYLR